MGCLVLIDIGAELAAQLVESRADAESLMLDTCEIGELGDPVTDPDTGEVTVPLVVEYPDPSWPDDHPWKHGPCKVQGLDPQELNPEVGGATLTVQRYRVDTPVGSFVPAVGKVVDMKTAALDPNLAGRRYRTVALLHKTLATAYRMAVEEGP